MTSNKNQITIASKQVMVDLDDPFHDDTLNPKHAGFFKNLEP